MSPVGDDPRLNNTTIAPLWTTLTEDSVSCYEFIHCRTVGVKRVAQDGASVLTLGTPTTVQGLGVDGNPPWVLVITDVSKALCPIDSSELALQER